MDIQYLKHNDIDFNLWDNCIEQSTCPLIYATSWYLNCIAPGWDGLVWGNYDAVMPLTHRKKYFINYLYQPFFAQQLGIFSKSRLSGKQQLAFIKAIPNKFKFIDIQLNEHQNLLAEEYPLRKRKNYLLNLQKPYDKLVKNYNQLTKRNLKKAHKQNMVVKYISCNDAVNFYQKYKGGLTKGVKAKDYEKLKAVLEIADSRKYILTKAVYNGNNELLACAVFMNYRGRIIFVIGTASHTGREVGAMYYLFDTFIHQHAENPLILDFEGSEIPGIARFFKGFGSEKVYYYKYKLNRLPWFLKWVKR